MMSRPFSPIRSLEPARMNPSYEDPRGSVLDRLRALDPDANPS
jgi:hypothetical protein